ncbi:LIF receptor subunit alpha b isoform X2 [Hemibagrus wyckioides]|uniref:LIF receptor subunit alpha b isoform X2 n=1 Tax=Hemibagrus wyckioides TaxID=337641 RepID=UPI00266BF93A|nr:LIF receptor subunit alpha b isoform X2 [Hemibagrus wyckioides]
MLLTTPKELNVSAEGGMENFGVSKMNIEWKDGFPNSIKPDKVTYDIEIFYTEQQKLVHNETIELKAHPLGHYNWSWTSPLPLQCTSHSVRLRSRDHDLTGDWTSLKTLPGKDVSDTEKTRVYPENKYILVDEIIRFCCILKPDEKINFSSTYKSQFTIRISNRTYATEPIRDSHPSPQSGHDMVCNGGGSVYYVGYPPDIHNFTCETHDLSSVECHWIEQESNEKTDHYINGRKCPETTHGRCVADTTTNTGVMKWTLTANNSFGKIELFDTADPKLRVHLEAPKLFVTQKTSDDFARIATLELKWDKQLKHYSIKCQVDLNGTIVNETSEGTLLTLLDLKPFTRYSARVQCGSRDNFYKWSDWSTPVTFFTNEDIPEGVDLWMQISDEQTYAVWKSPAQSNGEITGYELVIENSTDMTTKLITKSPTEFCHKLPADSAKTHQVISITAKNNAGVSHPYRITIPSLSPGVNTSFIKGINRTFYMAWEPSPMSKCGYVLDWYPTYQPQQCSVKWKTIPSDRSSATVDSDLKEGVKYTLSVYGCTSGPLSLMQRREGYVEELPPSGTVQNLKAKQEGLNIHLSWESVSASLQRGFIKGYNVSCNSAGGDEKKNVVISDPSTQNCKFSLSVKTYKCRVKAFTSAGDGPEAEITLTMNPLSDLYMAVVLTVVLFILCITAVFAYRNWKWLKSTLWPEIPQPRLSADFLKKSVYQWQVNDQLLCEESEVLKVNSPVICPVLVALELQKDHHETKALNSPHLWSEEYQTPPSNSQCHQLIDVDFSYKEIPCPGIPNPTYNMPLMPADNNSLMSGYRPQH